MYTLTRSVRKFYTIHFHKYSIVKQYIFTIYTNSKITENSITHMTEMIIARKEDYRKLVFHCKYINSWSRYEITMWSWNQNCFPYFLLYVCNKGMYLPFPCSPIVVHLSWSQVWLTASATWISRLSSTWLLLYCPAQSTLRTWSSPLQSMS